MKSIFLILTSIVLGLSACKKEEVEIIDTPIPGDNGLELNGYIGVNALPEEQDSVCPIPLYIDSDGTYESNGFIAGLVVPDFTLYDMGGSKVGLKEILESYNKPVLLINGSYTCPVFRGKIGEINVLENTFKNDILVYIVYVVEPHPIVDKSPYKDAVWTGGANNNENILYEQPKTYGERKEIIEDMLNAYTIDPQILVDGPCNEYWLNYGEAPNRAYLIKPDGLIYAAHGWFDAASMTTSIELLLTE